MKQRPAETRGQALIEAFLEMMAAERGASRNTREAYRRDLEDFTAFMSARKTSALSCARGDIEAYLAALKNEVLNPSSIARKLSSIRQLFHFLFSEKMRDDNPTATLATPKQGRRLPKTLTEPEMRALIKASTKDKTPEGLRLQAMLELVYGSGLRVSELVGLPLSSVQPYARVGKKIETPDA